MLCHAVLLLYCTIVVAVCTPAPPVTFAYNASNINSLQAQQVTQTGVDSEWVKHLGPTDSIEACAERCLAWRPTEAAAAKCRSFTRFTAHYAKNTSLAGQCYGHTDLAWVPNPIGPGQADSGVVEWPCEIDDDCSLNGKCGASNTCQCNTGWRGVRCETLSLAPVDMNQLGFSSTQDGRNMSYVLICYLSLKNMFLNLVKGLG